MKTKPRDKDEVYDKKKKNSDEMFCYSCGSLVKITSQVCPKCGVSLKYFKRNQPKEKETAILLAIFTSFFTWAYLIDKSIIKFWIGLAVSIISIIITKSLFDNGSSYWPVGLIPFIIIWIFAIIDVSIKDKEFYKSFGGA